MNGTPSVMNGTPSVMNGTFSVMNNDIPSFGESTKGWGTRATEYPRLGPTTASLGAWTAVFIVCLAVWAAARWLFFVGFEGSDDMFYARFAALWDRAPANHWEARLLSNALIRACIKAFGFSEWATVLPALAASLTILISTLLTCRWLGTVRQGWWAGLLAAVLPVEVTNATTVSAHAVMVGFMAAGTLAFVFAADSSRSRLVAAICLPLGVIAHYNGVYYVAALLLAGLLVERRRAVPAMVTVVIGGFVAVAAEMTAFWVLFGDPLCGFRLSSPQTLAKIGSLEMAGLTWPMVAWSLQQFVAEKPFGIALLVTAVAIICCYRDLSRPARVLAVTALVFWLVLSFGSYVPWEYRPFWRNTRYLHPLVMPVAVLFGMGICGLPVKRLAWSCGAATLALALLLLNLNGTWGQNVAISRELLEYVLQHPGQRFVTDVHTANEMYVLNRLSTPPNLAGTTDHGRTHYLDKQIRLLPEPAAGCDAVLINPLNAERTPSFIALVRPHLGPVEHQTPAGYRTVCEWIPSLQTREWAVRKPPARVHRLCGVE